MQYKVVTGSWTQTFDSWWELIGFLEDKLDYIGHNLNDVHAYFDCETFHLHPREEDYNDYIINLCVNLLAGIPEEHQIQRIRHVERRNYFVFDKEDRIINLSEIRESVKIFKRKPYKYKRNHRNYVFEFRREPVPFTGKSNYHSRFRKTRLNKNYYLDAMDQEYVDNTRIRNLFSSTRVYWWDDDESRRYPQRSWKEHRRTQYREK